MGVQPLGQLLNGLRQARLFDAVPELFRVDIFICLGNILRHGHVQNGEFLKYGAEQPVVFPAVKVPYIHAVQQHPPLGGVEQAAQKLYKGGLARAVQSHDGQLFSGANRQVKVVDGILLRAGVAEGHMLQLQFVGIRLGNRRPTLEPERLRIFQKFPHLRKVKAFLMQLLRRLQNAHDPCGEGGHRSKIQDKLRHTQRIPKRQMEEVRVGNAVPRHGEQRFGDIRQQLDLLAAKPEVQIYVVNAVKQFVQPVLQAENPDILRQLHGFRFFPDVGLLRVKRLFLIPVPENPVAGIPGHQKSHHAGRSNHHQQHPVQAGQDGKVHQETAHVLQQHRQGSPNVFRRFIVALHTVVRLFLELDELHVQRIGKRGHIAFSGDHADDAGAHIHPGVHGDLPQIFLQTHGQKQRQCKQSDGAQQLPHGGMALYAA